MNLTFEITGLPQLAKNLDTVAEVVSGPITKHMLEAGGEIIRAQAEANVHKLTGRLAGDIVVVTRVHQDHAESYVLIGPGWDPESFRRTVQRRGKYANEAPAADQTTNPGLYGLFLETGHRDPGRGLAHDLDYKRARRAAGHSISTAEFGTLSTPPYPWLGPAFNDRKEEALEVMAETGREELEALKL